MSDTSRRAFLTITGAGAAALGAAALAPSAVAAVAAAPPSSAGRLGETGPLVAYVSDVRSGRLSVMVGEREVVVADPDLVARFARLAASAR